MIYRIFFALSALFSGYTHATVTMDAQSQQLLEEMNKAMSDNIMDMPLSELRKQSAAHAQVSKVPLASIEDIKIPGPRGDIPMRIYTPFGIGPFPVYIYFHGGGWVFGTLNDSVCRDIASQAGIMVISVDYRLAPENKFPVPLNDCYAASLWIANNIQKYKGIPTKMAIGGDSAGGNLAAAVTLLARDYNKPKFQGAVLIYPALQNKFDTPSYNAYASGYILTKDMMEWFWNQYLKNPEDGNNPYASPLLAKDFKGLPPTLLIQAEYDPLYDEGRLYADKLEQAGIPVKIASYPTIHVFYVRSQNLDVAKEAITETANYLKQIFGL